MPDATDPQGRGGAGAATDGGEGTTSRPVRSGRTGEGTASLRRVLTAVDFHESSAEAVGWVMRHLAPDAEHELLHVLDVPEVPTVLRGLWGQREEVRLAARSGAEHRLEELRALAPDVRVRTHLVQGSPAAEIVRLAAELSADLVVVGEQGPKRGIGALLGSTAERVLIGSRVPVLVARKSEDAPPRRLLVAVDDSEPCDRTLAWAGSVLARFGGAATVLHSVDRRVLAEEMEGLEPPDALPRLQEEAVTAMRGWLDGKVSAAGLPRAKVDTRVVVGDPAYEIISAAAHEEADLIVIGSRAGDVARTPLMGRIVNKVVRSAPCSVLVVRHLGER